MKTLNFFLISIGFVLFGANNLPGQTFWELNGNPVLPGQFLGSTNNQFLDFHQNNTRRVRHTNVNWPGYNNAVAAANSTRIHFSLDGNYQLPFSMMHLGSALSVTLSRPWMHVGTTYGAGGDIMHVGIMQSPDPSGSQQGGDAVIAWGDNDDGFSPQQGPDNLRFLFISPSNVNNLGAESPQGRETMRITPMGNLGIGNFSNMPFGIGPTYGQPRARLDVQFRNNLPANTENTAAIFHNDVFANVGQSLIQYKRGIHGICENTNLENVEHSVGGDFLGSGAKYSIGVEARSRGVQGGESFGVRSFADEPDGGSIHYGLWSQARLGLENIGVLGQGYQWASGNFAAGVHGIAGGAGPFTNDWAGYFDGAVFSSLGYNPSDENLKYDVEPVENASEILSQISPKTYQYSQDIPQINLPTGNNFGVLAQEVEEVLPELVATFNTPTKFDEEGNEIEPIQIKAIRYNDFIALLIAGFNEQQVAIGAQAAEIAAQTAEMELKNQELELLQNQLDIQDAKIQAMEEKMIAFDTKFAALQQKTQNCCQQENQDGQGFEPTQKQMPSPTELGQNIPNPFESTTRIDFVLPNDADVMLEISDAQGRTMRTLIDGKMSGGNHTTTFDGSGLAAGIYYYSLYANGELITKRMMKL